MPRKYILKHEKTTWLKKKSKRHILSPRKKKPLKRLKCSKRNSFIYIIDINSMLCTISSSGISETAQAVQAGFTDGGLGSGTNELVTSGYQSVMSSNASGFNIPSIQRQLSNQSLTQVPDQYLDNATYCKEPYFEYNEARQEFVESPEVSITHADQEEQEDLSEVEGTSDIASTVMDPESQPAINYKRSEDGASITAAGDTPGVSERSYNLLYIASESCLSPSTADRENNGQDYESIEDQQTSEVISFNFHDTRQNTDHGQDNESVNPSTVERESHQETGPDYNVVELLPGSVPDYNDVELSPVPVNHQQTERGTYLEDRDVNILRNELSYDINISSCRGLQQNGCFPKCWICFNGQAVVENTPCFCICYCLDCAPGMIKCALCHQDIYI